MNTQYISIGISVFGFLVTIASWGYILGKNQANTQHMKEKILENKADYKEKILENKADYKEHIEKHELKQEKTITRLYTQIEKMNCVKKDDCEHQSSRFEARLESYQAVVCSSLDELKKNQTEMAKTLAILVEKTKDK